MTTVRRKTSRRKTKRGGIRLGLAREVTRHQQQLEKIRATPMHFLDKGDSALPEWINDREDDDDELFPYPKEKKKVIQRKHFNKSL